MPRGTESEPGGLAEQATAETERLVAWLRVLAIALIGAAQGLVSQNRTEDGFLEAILAYSAFGLAVLAWVYLRPIRRTLPLATTAVDVAAITALAILSGGAFSDARTAYFLIPIAVAFRFRPLFTAIAAAATVAAYVIEAVLDSAFKQEGAERFIAIHAGYLAWVGLAAVLLSALLAQRTRRVTELAAARQRLIAEAMSAEERERRGLAEGLHDHAIQNLLSARHDVEEVAADVGHPALARADAALSDTVEELREAVFELHPFVLDQAGLEAALRAIGQRAARRGGFALHLDLSPIVRQREEHLLFAVVRELFANVVEHAGARNVWVRLKQEQSGEIALAVRDDGRGFDPDTLPDRLALGHIGLASQRERVTSVGGSFEIRAAEGKGTTIAIRIPSAASSPARLT